jgi:hypothetical protein
MDPEEPMLTPEPNESEALRRIREALKGLSFGEVTVVVQDGVVVQVQRMEKVRIPQR